MAQRNPQRANRRDRQRVATRQRVFEAAVAEFLEVGFASAQIERIADAAGVSRGTFYFHFPRKEHVLLEIQRQSSEATAERLDALGSREAGLREVLECLVEGIRGTQAELESSSLVRDVLGLFVTGTDAGLMEERSTRLVDALEAQLTRCAERGEFREDLGPDQVALIVMTSLFGLLVNQSSPNTERVLSTDRLIDVLIRGVER